MSGGALDYLYSKIQFGADDLETHADRLLGKVSTDEAVYDYLEATDRARQRDRIANVARLMEDLSELLHAIEWSWSGDRSEGDWEEDYERFAHKWLRAAESTDRQANGTRDEAR